MSSFSQRLDLSWSGAFEVSVSDFLELIISGVHSEWRTKIIKRYFIFFCSLSGLIILGKTFYQFVVVVVTYFSHFCHI